MSANVRGISLSQWVNVSAVADRAVAIFASSVKDGRDWMTAAKNMGKWH